jgi:hypothetical protein
MAYIIDINYNAILNVFIFLHVWVLLVLNNFLKWLLDNFSNNSLRILSKVLNYSFIETISQDNYISSSDESDESSDESEEDKECSGYISGFECGKENHNLVRKIKGSNNLNASFLSFALDIDYSRHNKYRFQSDEGVYIIRSAFTFRKNNNKNWNNIEYNACNIISIDNKLTIWCRIISPYKLYLDDIKRFAREKDNNFYFFMILEELQSGFKHKLLIDVAKKITLPERKSIMFSKISIRQYPQTSSACGQS